MTTEQSCARQASCGGCPGVYEERKEEEAKSGNVQPRRRDFDGRKVGEWRLHVRRSENLKGSKGSDYSILMFNGTQ